MTKSVFFTLIILCLLIGSSSSQEPKKRTIAWFMLDYSPYYIRDKSEEGVHNFIAKYFSKKMTKYNHRFIDVNASRLFQLLTSKSDIIYCSPGLGGTPFKKEVIYSDSMFYAPSPGLAVLKTNPIFDANKISLRETLKSTNIKIGWPEKGTFGPYMQETLETYRKRITLINKVSIDIGTAMVLKSRVDGFLAYPLAFYYRQKNNREAALLKFVKLKDISPFTPTHSLCSNTAGGKMAIEEINKVLKTKDYKMEMKKVLLKFMPPFVEKEFLEKNY